MLAELFRYDGWPDLLRWASIGCGLLAAGWIIGVAIEARAYKLPPPPMLWMGASYLAYQATALVYVHERLGHPFGWPNTLVHLANLFALIGALWTHRYYQPDRRRERHRRENQAAAEKLLEQLRQRSEGKTNEPDPP